ncbi:HAD-like domain-containing protein [Dunaliella salina]|uniref:HAD-like domain-containing protein n=1 Tax=Dunaliella salina TaxID=3046 RepID=A0ABQ7G8H4_DUNSA|nr:HAD-like domain-containing protein [Dunaliella salina]|eukprot:KAF5830883.1 HAD-like domain-containing protein [Dunaliella salina]
MRLALKNTNVHTVRNTGGMQVPRACTSKQMCKRRPCMASAAPMKALVLDLGGVLIEPGEHHRQAYNEAFQKFEVLQAQSPTAKVVNWGEGIFAELENRSGSDSKLQYYFEAQGWGPNKITKGVPKTPEEKQHLVSELMAYQTQRFQQMMESGQVIIEPRPGVVRVIDEAVDLGLKLAVCTTSRARDSLLSTLRMLLGEERAAKLDCVLAGDDVAKKKPDPEVYRKAAASLGVQPSECVCIEDSTTGLQAALQAGMRVIVTYTDATKTQAFEGAERVISALGYPANVTALELKQQRLAQDDRIHMDVTDSAIQFLMNPRG